MINGAHSIIFSRDADLDRAFLKDVLNLSSVDVGGGWLIFGLPPAEVAIHPGEKNDIHELYLMTDDVNGLVASLRARGFECQEPRNLGWGVLTQVTLPGGGKLGIYEPRHARPTTGATTGAVSKAKPKTKTAPKGTSKRPAKLARATKTKSSAKSKSRSKVSPRKKGAKGSGRR